MSLRAECMAVIAGHERGIKKIGPPVLEALQDAVRTCDGKAMGDLLEHIIPPTTKDCEECGGSGEVMIPCEECDGMGTEHDPENCGHCADCRAVAAKRLSAGEALPI